MSIYEMINEMPMFKEFSTEETKVFAEMDHSLIECKPGEIITKEVVTEEIEGAPEEIAA